MRCYNCGNTLLEKRGSLQLPSDILNNYVVDNINYFSCPSCNEIILTDETWRRADETESRLIQQYVEKMPINGFVSASKAASILEMSRQALHKHRRISRGFVYSVNLDGKTFYNLKSLNLFKKIGDGRFPLVKKTPSVKKEYVLITIPAPKKGRFTEQDGKESLGKWEKSPHKTFGQVYAH